MNLNYFVSILYFVSALVIMGVGVVYVSFGAILTSLVIFLMGHSFFISYKLDKLMEQLK